MLYRTTSDYNQRSHRTVEFRPICPSYTIHRREHRNICTLALSPACRGHQTASRGHVQTKRKRAYSPNPLNQIAHIALVSIRTIHHHHRRIPRQASRWTEPNTGLQIPQHQRRDSKSFPFCCCRALYSLSNQPAGGKIDRQTRPYDPPTKSNLIWQGKFKLADETAFIMESI